MDGLAHIQGRHIDEAIGELNTVLSKDPTHPQALYILGVALLDGKSDREGALAAWNKLVQSHPELPELNIVKDHAVTVNDKVKSVVIYFTYVQYYNKKMKEYRYHIELSPNAITRDFNIINIFNLDKPENGKVFYPVKGQKYVYDYIYPGGGILTRRI